MNSTPRRKCCWFFLRGRAKIVREVLVTEVD